MSFQSPEQKYDSPPALTFEAWRRGRWRTAADARARLRAAAGGERTTGSTSSACSSRLGRSCPEARASDKAAIRRSGLGSARRRWEEHGLVFSSAVGKLLDAANVRRAFRQALKDVDGIDADEWTPRELGHSFVSLLSDRGVPLEEISRLVGHSGTAVTEEVYRKQIRPVIQTGAVVMDGIFGGVPQQP